VTEKIKVRNHPAGAVILIVKRGATRNSFGKLSYAGEVIASLKEQSNIRLFAIEFQQSTLAPYINLQSVVKASKGVHYIINSTSDIKPKLVPILTEVKQLLEQGIKPFEEIQWNVIKVIIK